MADIAKHLPEGVIEWSPAAGTTRARYPGIVVAQSMERARQGTKVWPGDQVGHPFVAALLSNGLEFGTGQVYLLRDL